MKKYTAWILALLFYATSLVWNVNPSISDGWKVNLEDNTVLMEHLKVGNPSEATTSAGGHAGHYISTQIVSPFAVDVRDYGATSGGSVSANATALAAAFAYAEANNLPILIPPGTFAYNGSGLTYTTAGVTTGMSGVFGGGPSSILDYQGSGVALTMSDNTGQGNIGPYLANFQITTSAGTPTGGLLLGGGTMYQFLNVDKITINGFTEVGGYCMKISKVVSTHINDSNFYNCYYPMTTNSEADSFPTTVTFSNTRFRAAGKHGGFIKSGVGITFDQNCVFESNQGSGLVVEGNDTGGPPIENIRVLSSHFESNGLDGSASDYNIDVTGYNSANPITNIYVEKNHIQDTLSGGHIRYGNIWYSSFKDNRISGTDGPEDVSNIGGNRHVEWVSNNTIDETNVILHGNNAEEANQYSATGINLYVRGATFWTTHQLKASKAFRSLPGDNSTLTTIASLVLNGTGADIAGGMVLVSGYNTGLTKYFVDLVALSYGAAAVIKTSDTVGSPAARTYSVSSNVNLQVKFANDSDAYSGSVSQLTN